MEHKGLHKVNLMTIKTKENRAQLQKGLRASKREKLHATHRNISIDPDDIETDINEDNITRSNSKSRRSSIVRNTLSSSERFNQKFLLWKQQKARNFKKKQIKKPAFISSVPNNRFLPSKENEKFSKVPQVATIKPAVKPITVKPIQIKNKFNGIQNNHPVNIKLIKSEKKSATKKNLLDNKKEKFEAINKPLFNLSTKVEKINQKQLPPKLTKPSINDNIFRFNSGDDSTNSKEVKMEKDQIINIHTFLATNGKEEKIENDEIIDQNLNDTTFSINSNEELTPEKPINKFGDQLNTSTNQYLSPFVSTARGKGSIIREKKTRDTVYKIQSEEPELSDSARKCKAASLYFRNSLNLEVERLNNIANKWELYKQDTINLIEDAIDMIDVAVGQTRLLITKKFEQFRKLIEQCENMVSDEIVLPSDLEGFWAMLYIQIENLNQRYEKLEILKLNSWIDADLIIESNTKQNNDVKKIRKKKIKNVKSSFDIKAMVQKAQMNYKEKRRQQEAGEISKTDETDIFGNIGSAHKTTKINKNISLSDGLNSTKVKSSKKSILKTVDTTLKKNLRNKSVAFTSPSNQFIIDENDDIANDFNKNKCVNFNVEDSVSLETPIKTHRKTKTNEKYVCTPMPEKLADDSVNIADSKNRRRSTRTPKRRVSLCDLNHNTSSNRTPTSIKSRKSLKFNVTDDDVIPSCSNTETPVPSSIKSEKNFRKSNRKIKLDSSYIIE